MVWSKHFDPSTRLYYYHDAATLETTWELPSGAQVMPFLILASKQRNEVPVPFVVPAPPWKGFMDNNGDSGELDDDADDDELNGSGEEAMALEVRQMAMEAFLQESGLQVYTRRLLELGVKSMGGLADPSVLSDADLIKTVGMTMGQVGLFRKSTGAVSVHLPPNVRKSISLSCGLGADSAAPQAAPPVVSTPPAAAAAAALAAAAPATSSASAARVSEYLPRSVVHWSGWLEKRGRSAFSKVEKRYFVLREGGPPTTSFEEHSAVKFGEPMYYSLEYFAAPPNLKYNVGLDVGEDPLSKGYEQKGCLDVAQVSSVSLGSKADKKRTVSFTTPEKPFELVAVSEACASDLDTALSRCLESLQKPCVALTLPPHSPPASPSAAPPAAPPTPEQASASAATSSRSDPSALAPPSSSSSPSPVFAVDAMPSRSSSSGSKATAQGDSRESAAKDNDFFKQQAEAKRSERESMLKKMTSEQKGAFLKEEADVKAHDDRKSKHVLKTTRAFGPAGGNPLTSGRGGRGGRGGK